ncbi:hypothetical protein JAAARDRAFT_201027 [Jaapia argillacea MUCL 33604]|uniref:Uncharacterized protein n=1 Tax=Jaapia argillacea MUCL 33604 TaxID=933084 RepID=A0A067PFI9_9AGAM|nr:hypothetical protein JAAARDRAFT_201027 [Jaapia argillacea MUCL 33604]
MRDGWGLGMRTELAVGNAIWCEGIKAGVMKHELLPCLSLIYAFFYPPIRISGTRDTPLDWTALFGSLSFSGVDEAGGKPFRDQREWYLEDDVPASAKAFVSDLALQTGLTFYTKSNLILEPPVGAFFVSLEHRCLDDIVSSACTLFPWGSKLSSSHMVSTSPKCPSELLARLAKFPPALSPPCITNNHRTQVLRDLLMRQQDHTCLLVAWYLQSFGTLEFLYQAMQRHQSLLGMPTIPTLAPVSDLEATPRLVGGGTRDIPAE